MTYREAQPPPDVLDATNQLRLTAELEPGERVVWHVVEVNHFQPFHHRDGRGVLRISDRQDASRTRDLLALQPFGVAAPVEPFLMVQDHLGDRAEVVRVGAPGDYARG